MSPKSCCGENPVDSKGKFCQLTTSRPRPKDTLWRKQGLTWASASTRCGSLLHAPWQAGIHAQHQQETGGIRSNHTAHHRWSARQGTSTALFYGCVIPYVALGTPSLSQPMNYIKSGLGPTDVPSLDAKQDVEFDWEWSGPLSARASRALAYLKVAMDRHGSLSRALHGNRSGLSLQVPFIAGITYHASISEALAGARSSRPVLQIQASWLLTISARLQDSASLAQPTSSQQPLVMTLGAGVPGDAGLSQCFLAVLAVSQRFALRDQIVLISGDYCGALITALQKGSFRSPALQNEELPLNEMFMRVTPNPALFLHALGEVMKAGGVDHLSRAVAADQRACELTNALHAIALREARKLGELLLVLYRPHHRTPGLCTPYWIPCRMSRRTRPAGLGTFIVPSLWAGSLRVRLCLPAPSGPRQDRRQGTVWRPQRRFGLPIHHLRHGLVHIVSCVTHLRPGAAQSEHHHPRKPCVFATHLWAVLCPESRLLATGSALCCYPASRHQNCNSASQCKATLTMVTCGCPAKHRSCHVSHLPGAWRAAGSKSPFCVCAAAGLGRRLPLAYFTRPVHMQVSLCARATSSPLVVTSSLRPLLWFRRCCLVCSCNEISQLCNPHAPPPPPHC